MWSNSKPVFESIYSSLIKARCYIVEWNFYSTTFFSVFFQLKPINMRRVHLPWPYASLGTCEIEKLQIYNVNIPNWGTNKYLIHTHHEQYHAIREQRIFILDARTTKNIASYNQNISFVRLSIMRLNWTIQIDCQSLYGANNCPFKYSTETEKTHLFEFNVLRAISTHLDAIKQWKWTSHKLQKRTISIYTF